MRAGGLGQVQGRCARAFLGNSPSLTVVSREMRNLFSPAETKVSGLHSVEVAESQFRRFNSEQRPVTPTKPAIIAYQNSE